MNRQHDSSVTHWEQRNFRKPQPGLLHHRTERMEGIYPLLRAELSRPVLHVEVLNPPVPQNMTIWKQGL